MGMSQATMELVMAPTRSRPPVSISPDPQWQERLPESVNVLPATGRKLQS